MLSLRGGSLKHLITSRRPLWLRPLDRLARAARHHESFLFSFFIFLNYLMTYGSFKKRAFRRRSTPYSRGFRGSKGYRGFRSVRPRGGYGRKLRSGYISRKRYAPPVLRRKRAGVYRGRVSSSSVPSRQSIQLAAASALASSGTFTFAGFSERVDFSVGRQGWASPTSSAWLCDVTDINPVLVNAIANTLILPNGATPPTPRADPRFWIKDCSLEVNVVNCSQVSAQVWFYPWSARYDNINIENLYSQTGADTLETPTTSAYGPVGIVDGNETTIGWSPFQSRSITQSLKLGKPVRMQLDGGVSRRFKVKNSKPLSLNYARLSGGTASFRGYTRGVFIIIRSNPVNDKTEHTDIGFSGGSCDIQCIKRYSWISTPTPYHYNDISGATTSFTNGYEIIQPQTGILNTAPTIA